MSSGISFSNGSLPLQKTRKRISIVHKRCLWLFQISINFNKTKGTTESFDSEEYIIVLMLLGTFINMKQCCGHWKNWYKMINFSLRELKFLRNMYFIYNERLPLAKVEKGLSLQRNYKKVIFLLIYHISGF